MTKQTQAPSDPVTEQREGDPAQAGLIERLQKSLEEAEKTEFDQGFGDGRKWATEFAETRELQRLAAFRESSEHWEGEFIDDNSSAYSARERLFFELQPDYNACRTSAREFWERHASCEPVGSKDPYCQGFAEGALDVWHDVEDQL